MASSRKSRRPNKAVADVTEGFERALEDILARVVFSGDGALAVAFSGGLDSAVLLRLAADHCRHTGRRLLAFHVHHGLSPNADAWLTHCAAEVAALGIAFDSARVVLEDTAGEGIEQLARGARYRALSSLCSRHGVQLLLTAHHQDDQAETVLLQLLRGAGPRGLSAMAGLQRAHPLLAATLPLGRPLLGCSRRALEQAADALGIRHVTDESNADIRYRRNAVRHQILPSIEQHFPGSAAALARSSRHLQSAQRLLDDLAIIDEAMCAEGGGLRIDRLQALSPDRIDNLLRHWLAGQGALQAPTEAQLEQLHRQMLSARADAHPSLVLAGLSLQRHGRLLVAVPHLPGAPPAGELCLRWQGESEIAVPAWRGVLLFRAHGGPGLPAARLQHGEITLQARSGGERLRPDPLRPSRSLKNLFQEAGVAAQQRPWLPLVYLDGRLIFAAGLGMDACAVESEPGVTLEWRAE